MIYSTFLLENFSIFKVALMNWGVENEEFFAICRQAGPALFENDLANVVTSATSTSWGSEKIEIPVWVQRRRINWCPP
jgi:hypothetical protein